MSDFAGDFCGVYSSAIHAVLPRLLSAAAPPGNTAQENRRQCLKASKLSFMFNEVKQNALSLHICFASSYFVNLCFELQ